jgi:hypothetical protein
VDRIGSIPPDRIKITPSLDPNPPILHSDEFHPPVPLPGISTAGGEDSPFIPSDGGELYFFFVGDVRQDASLQILDPVNGIWRSIRSGGTWQDPELVWLQAYGKLALNGCPWVEGEMMIFCTAREGYAGLSWFQARRSGSGWTDWEVMGFPPEHEVGELHLLGDELYFGSARPGGKGGQDIWMLTRSDGDWIDPVNLEAVNTPADETRPYLTPDGQELWFTREHQGSPAVFRSRRMDGAWQPEEIIISRFAGEPTLDAQGNLYFVHHFYEDGTMLEVDIYVAYRR